MKATEISNTLTNIRVQVELNSQYLESMVKDYVDKACRDLDILMAQIRKMLFTDDAEWTTQEYESAALKLSCILFYAGALLERQGIRADMSKSMVAEKENKIIRNGGGSVASNKVLAEIETQPEVMINIACTRAYKEIQRKVDAGEEVLAAIKKILTRRLDEAE